MNNRAAWLGALRYEFRMQVRRRALWISFTLLALFVYGSFGHAVLYNPHITSARTGVVVWAMLLAKLFPLGAGLLLADRVARDRTTGVDELLVVAPAAPLARLLGKYLGSTLATLLPIVVVYAAGLAAIVARWHDAAGVTVAPVAFAVACIPGLLFVGAFAIACTTALWPLLYQFLFVGYWFWGNFLNPRDGIPTLNGTLLTPDDDYIIRGAFPLDAYWPHATLTQAATSVVLLLGCAAVALLAAWRWLHWRAEHR